MGFGLGQEVISKKTGLPASGIIVMVQHPGFYKANAEARGSKCERWYELYPDWETKPIYVLALKAPQKTISFKEFKDAMERDGITDLLEIRQRYNECPEETIIAYPEDDLELI